MAVTDILVTPARVWKSPVATALPDETSVAFGAAWSSWTDCGYTLGPVTMKYDRALFELEVEQLLSPVIRRVTKEDIILEMTLAELTAANLALGIGGTVTTTAAGASQSGFEELNAGGDIVLPELQFGLEGFYLTTAGVKLPLRIFIYKANSIMNGALSFAKAAGAGIPLQVKGLPDTGKALGSQLVKFQRVTAVATS